MLRKNVAGQFVHIAGVNVTTGAVVTGATWTMRRCLDGTFAAGGATVTEDGTTGFYKVALAQADTNGNDLGYFFTATNCVPVTINALTTAADPSDTVRLGLTALPNAAANAAGGLPISAAGALSMDGIKSDTAAILADTGTDGVVVAAGSKTGYSLTATTGLGNQTANLTGNLSGSVGSVTGLTAATVHSDLDDIQARLPAALTAGGNIKADVLALDGSTDAATDLKTSALTIVRGAAITGTLSTTQMTTDLTEATDNHYNGRRLLWTSGALIDQATAITAYNGTTKMLTYTATTEPPANTDTFVIV